MDGITLCNDIECPARNSCQRFLQTAGPGAIFYTESPRNTFTDKCPYLLRWQDAVEYSVVKPIKKEPVTTLIKKKDR